jgi:hypothetical protein
MSIEKEPALLFEYNQEKDVLTIEGIDYPGDVFRGLSTRQRISKGCSPLNSFVHGLPSPFKANGCYVVTDSAGGVLYVGRSKNIYIRLLQHRNKWCWWASQIESIAFHLCERGEEVELELRLIKGLKPKYNIVENKGKEAIRRIKKT